MKNSLILDDKDSVCGYFIFHMLRITPLKWGEKVGSQMKRASLSHEYLLSEGASNTGAALK